MALIQCPECTTQISELAVVCPNCGKPQLRIAKHSFKRPVSGLIAGGILGTISLLFEFKMLITNLSILPVIITVSTLGPIFLMNPIIQLLGSSILLIGIVKTAFNKHDGLKIVRTTCMVMTILSMILGAFMFGSIVRNANSDAAGLHVLQSGFIRGTVGWDIIGVFTWCMLFFLFRKSITNEAEM